MTHYSVSVTLWRSRRKGATRSPGILEPSRVKTRESNATLRSQPDDASVSDWDEASIRAVALVAAMQDRFDGDSDGPPTTGNAALRRVRDRQCVVRVAQMITDGEIDGDQRAEWLIASLGLLASRAAEDLCAATGEPTALWLERWLSQPYGWPRADT